MEQKKLESGEKEKQAKKFVLDSSVIIKWFSQEENTDKALEIRENFLTGKIVLASPDIQLYEVANALRYNKNIEKEEIKNAVKSLIDIGLDFIVPTMDTMNSAIDIALEFDITIYDAHFIALAKELSFIFVTADEKLYEKIKRLGFVRLLIDT